MSEHADAKVSGCGIRLKFRGGLFHSHVGVLWEELKFGFIWASRTILRGDKVLCMSSVL